MARDKIDNSNTFSAKVTGRHAITLPAELCRRLGILVGDTVELHLENNDAILKRSQKPEPPVARGLLRGYFPSWDAVNRYVAEERLGWDQSENREASRSRSGSS